MPLSLNIKQKCKHRILWHLHIVQKSPLLKTRESYFSLVWLMEFSIYISVFGLSQSFSDISSLPILVGVQLLHENGKWILCVSNGATWLSVCLQTNWLWNRFLLQLLADIPTVSSKEHFDIQATAESTFTVKCVCDMMRTHSYTATGLLCFIKVFHLQQS